MDATLATLSTSLPSLFPGQWEDGASRGSLQSQAVPVASNPTLDALLSRARDATATAATQMQPQQQAYQQQSQPLQQVSQQPQQLRQQPSVLPAAPQQPAMAQQQQPLAMPSAGPPSGVWAQSSVQPAQLQQQQQAQLQQFQQQQVYAVPSATFDGLQQAYAPPAAAPSATAQWTQPSLAPVSAAAPVAPVPVPVAAPVPAPSPAEDLTNESLMLQQHLARQTDEMQQYLQNEMTKLSAAIRQTAQGIHDTTGAGRGDTSPLSAYATAATAAPHPPASVAFPTLPSAPAVPASPTRHPGLGSPSPLTPSNMTHEISRLRDPAPVHPPAGATFANPTSLRATSPTFAHPAPSSSYTTPLTFRSPQAVLSIDEAHRRLQSPVWEAPQGVVRALAPAMAQPQQQPQAPPPAPPQQQAPVPEVPQQSQVAQMLQEPEARIQKQPSFATTATTSFPTIHMFDSVASGSVQQSDNPGSGPLAIAQKAALAHCPEDQTRLVLNPPSASGASGSDVLLAMQGQMQMQGQGQGGQAPVPQESLASIADSLKMSLMNSSDADKAMGFAQMLSALDTERLIDVVHSVVPHMQRKEVSLTWRALISQYQAAAAQGNAVASTIGQSAAMSPYLLGGSTAGSFPRHGSAVDTQPAGCDQAAAMFYELEDSLPPTPKSSVRDSELSRKFAANGVDTALEEVMQFIDKPLSPRTLQRMATVRQKAAGIAGEQQGASAAQAFSIPFDPIPGIP